MISTKNILNTATYESKTLFRSWFFRIFSGIALFFLTLINIGFFGNHNGAMWISRAIPANFPYFTILMLNVAQSIIAVFLASDFLRRDKKLDTTEVIYTRPISNGEYVIGKTLGILFLFVGLVIFALVIALIFNLVKQDAPVCWITYLYYPLLITIPSLVFILGFSFSLMILVKNQAVTFVLLLGYIGVNLFYFQDKLFGILDYMAFNLPMVYSDMVGFTDFKLIVLHRLAYLLLGIGFIFATIRYLNRLPQVGKWNFVNLSAFVIFVLAGFGSAFQYYQTKHQGENKKLAYQKLNNEHAKYPIADILSNNISVAHKNNTLQVSSEIWIKNSTTKAIDTIILSLNPGFIIDSIASKDEKVNYYRNQQIVQIIPKEKLEPRHRKKYSIHYHGIPDDDFAYLELPKKRRYEIKRMMMAPVNKNTSFVTANYVMLTPEVVWYPISGVTFNNTNFLHRTQDFSRYRLSVTTKENLTVISSGKKTTEGNTTTFNPEKNLSSLSLIIGKYEQKSINIDKVEHNLYYFKDHDFFSSYFESIKDTVGSIIKAEREEYEYDEIDLYYSFKRINLVEVPLQFHVYERAQTQSTDYIQPEIIFFPEKGAGISTVDFSRTKRAEDKKNKKQENARTEEEIAIDILKRFLRNTFFREGTNLRGGGGFNNRLVSYEGVNYKQNPFCAFPLYYNHLTSINSEKYPLFNAMMELYLKEGFEIGFRESFEGGMSDKERANLALKDNSMEELFDKWNHNLISGVISQAGSFIIQGLKNKVGSSEFDDFLYYYLEGHYNQTINFETFAQDFYRDFDIDIEPYFAILNNKGTLPAFITSPIEFIQTRDDIGEVYLVKFKASNIGDAKGMLNVTFRMPRSSDTENEQRLYEIDPGQNKDIQITMFDRPRMMSISTLISSNIPSTFSEFLRTPVKSSTKQIEEYDVVSEIPVQTTFKGEYIVDNEDEGFSFVSVSRESKIKQYFNRKNDDEETVRYKSVNRYWSPAIWTPVAHSAFYGEAILSGLYTRSGDGSNVAQWTTYLPEAGSYDIYTYIPMSAMYQRPQRRPEGQNGNQGGNKQGAPGQGGPQRQGPQFADKGYEYTYIVSSNEGTEEVKFVLDNIEDGWNKIGTFHFAANSATVTLSNKVSGKRVFADAIKWVAK